MAIEVQFMDEKSLSQMFLRYDRNYCTSLPPLNFADKEEQVCSDGRYSQLYSADLPAVPPPT